MILLEQTTWPDAFMVVGAICGMALMVWAATKL